MAGVGLNDTQESCRDVFVQNSEVRHEPDGVGSLIEAKSGNRRPKRLCRIGAEFSSRLALCDYVLMHASGY